MADKLEARDVERLLLESPDGRRYVQDSPILPDVWKACWIEALRPPGRRRRLDLLVTPHLEVPASRVALELQKRLNPAWSPEPDDGEEEDAPEEDGEGRPEGAAPADRAAVAYNASIIAARLRFEELVRVVLPMTDWWRKNLWKGKVEEAGDVAAVLEDRETAEAVARAVADGRLARARGGEAEAAPVPPDLLWTIRVVGAIAVAHSESDEDHALLLGYLRAVREAEADEELGAPEPASGSSGGEARLAAARRMVTAVLELLREIPAPDREPLVFSVNRNRRAEVCLCDSALAVKADAARHLFDVRAGDITWAVIDSGIDARHPAFAKRVDGKLEKTRSKKFPYETRVAKTFDFSLVRYLLSPDTGLARLRIDELTEKIERRPGSLEAWAWEKEREALERLPAKLGSKSRAAEAKALRRSLQKGRQVDWDLVREVLEVPHRPDEYRPPANNHGTHVAGILGGDWRVGDPGELRSDRDLVGVCPDIRLYDLRVLGPDGRGDEFAVIAALQFVRHLNSHKDYMVVHGANLSLSIRHEVSNYACGRTPVCEEAERLAAAGVVVVAAAGNRGYLTFLTQEGPSEGYHSISITDPGNAQNVLTVGATHRSSPHTYGVSYFSSRGPTGDGRSKPDLVAPGEKILSAAPDGRSCRLDGTSMAAPHASGAAALLMARHRELAGQPRRIKEILCATATDLGRERYFQGAGMLDALRALQSV